MCYSEIIILVDRSAKHYNHSGNAVCTFPSPAKNHGPVRETASDFQNAKNIEAD